MQYDPSPQIFFKQNYADLTRLIIYLGHMPLTNDDVAELIDSFYISCYNTRTLQRYDPTRASISTYVTIALRNHIHAKLFDKTKRSFTGLSEELPAKEEHNETIDLQRFLKTLRGTDRIIAKRLMDGELPNKIAESLRFTPSALSFYRNKLRRMWLAYIGQT